MIHDTSVRLRLYGRWRHCTDCSFGKFYVPFGACMEESHRPNKLRTNNSKPSKASIPFGLVVPNPYPQVPFEQRLPGTGIICRN